MLFRDRLVTADFLHCDETACTVRFLDLCHPLVTEEHTELSNAQWLLERRCYDEYTIGIKKDCPKEVLERERVAAEKLAAKRAIYDCTGGERIIVVPRGTPEYDYYRKAMLRTVDKKI